MGKRVVTEHKTIDVPVEREEIVIERRPGCRPRGQGRLTDEEIVIPVKEEQRLRYQAAVVTEEVSVGKRKVHETKHVAETVRKEELDVNEEGDVKVKGGGALAK